MAMVAAAAGTDAATDALLSMEVVQQAPQPIVSGRPCMLFLLSRYTVRMDCTEVVEFILKKRRCLDQYHSWLKHCFVTLSLELFIEMLSFYKNMASF